MTIRQQCFYVFSLLSVWVWGYLMGKFIEKRKRDKQMAGLVTDRLLGKSNSTSNDMQEMTQAQARFMAQQANLAGISNHLSSLAGSSTAGGKVDGSGLGQSKTP